MSSVGNIAKQVLAENYDAVDDLLEEAVDDLLDELQHEMFTIMSATFERGQIAIAISFLVGPLSGLWFDSSLSLAVKGCKLELATFMLRYAPEGYQPSSRILDAIATNDNPLAYLNALPTSLKKWPKYVKKTDEIRAWIESKK